MQNWMHYAIPFLLIGFFIYRQNEANHWFSKAYPEADLNSDLLSLVSWGPSSSC